MEAAGGFEPPNRGFADRSLNHLGMPPNIQNPKSGPPGDRQLKSGFEENGVGSKTPGRRHKMERETGFEPATSTLARLHSTTELFPRCSSK